MTWETVVGLEVHVQLRTERKLFCGDRAVFGDEPNTHVCPVCLGLPGALPAVNPEAVRLALRAALALGCTVHAESIWARKNYFYPDLPKGYQITQFERPLATDGRVRFEGSAGGTTVRIRRVHMEEDAGKSLHDRIPRATAVDLNRAGTPLVEIVTEPDLGSPADVRAFLTGLKRILEYAAVSDCNMEEGSLRADANVSVRRLGRKRLGTKTEIKNVNSFSGIERAVDIEVARQRRILESGGQVRPETLLWDDHRGRLRPMRSKEESHDYRYFPDPDLPSLVISSAEVERARSELPELPADRLARLVAAHGLTRYDAEVLTRSAATADYFERAAGAGADAKALANWVMGPVQALMNERGEDAASFPVRPETLATLVRMVDDGVVSDGAARTVLASLAREGGDPERLVDEMGLRQVREKGRLDEWIATVLDENAEVADRYRAGEEKLLGFLVGRVIRRSEGRADPRRVGEILRERLGHE